MLYMHHLHRTVGTLRPDGVFITHRKEEHIFRKYNGLGMSFRVLKELLDFGCWKIVIVLHMNDGSELMLKARPEDFLNRGEVYLDKQDAQRILPLSFLAQEKIVRWT